MESNTLDLIETIDRAFAPALSNAKTLSRVHLQDRFVGLCVPLVLIRKGRSALRPCRLRASSTDGLSRGSGVHHTKQNSQEGAPRQGALNRGGLWPFRHAKPHDLNV